MWDFLRELGEANVGGAAIVKNQNNDEHFELQSISQARLHNIARAYGWWIAKDSVSLLVLKVSLVLPVVLVRRLIHNVHSPLTSHC